MKNITVAIDFDEEATDVLDHAAALATDSGAELHVVHVYPSNPEIPIAPYVYPTPMDAGGFENHEETLQDQKLKIREIVGALHKKDIKASGYMKPTENKTARAILEFTREREADLIIIGTHRPGRLERFMIGSTAEEVVRKSTIPVLVIPRSEN